MISIIVPAYNVGAYIDRCITSILNQTYENIQIILIDDGSTDDTGTLCDKYAAQDHRIQVFHQEHQGVSASRNIGLNNCKGDYIGFVDGDDWCEPEMFMSMVNEIQENGTDIVRCNYRFIFNDKTEMLISDSNKVFLTGREAVINMHHHTRPSGYGTSIWNTLIRSEIIRKPYMLYFDTALDYGEDADLLRQLLMRCQSVELDPGCYYNYNRQNVTSLTHRTNYEKLIKAINKKILFLQSNDFPETEVCRAQSDRMKCQIYDAIEHYMMNGDDISIDKTSFAKCLDMSENRLLPAIKLYVLVILIWYKASPKIVHIVWNIHR